jgi:hypothetical protein
MAAEAQEMLVVSARTISRALPLTEIDAPCAATFFSCTNNLFLLSLCELIDDLFLPISQKSRGISLGGGVENRQAHGKTGGHSLQFASRSKSQTRHYCLPSEPANTR